MGSINMQHIIVEDGVVTPIFPPLVITEGDLFMTFAFSANDTPAIVKVQVLGDLQLPQPIKDFIILGIDALIETDGPDHPVAVSAHGHVHSEGNDKTTSVSLNVYPAPAP